VAVKPLGVRFDGAKRKWTEKGEQTEQMGESGTVGGEQSLMDRSGLPQPLLLLVRFWFGRLRRSGRAAI
jgi:hypothetical protein